MNSNERAYAPIGRRENCSSEGVISGSSSYSSAAVVYLSSEGVVPVEVEAAGADDEDAGGLGFSVSNSVVVTVFVFLFAPERGGGVGVAGTYWAEASVERGEAGRRKRKRRRRPSSPIRRAYPPW
jgi:hypothetical protein